MQILWVKKFLLMNTLIGHFTYKYETNKAMSFDQYGNCNTFEKVFVHLADKYIISGQTNGYYSDDPRVARIVGFYEQLAPATLPTDW